MLLNLRAQYSAGLTARQTADAVISALTPAAWYRNATDVVSSGGFASIWADYASSDKGLVLPGVALNYASVPDSAPLSVTGDIDIRVRVNLADYTPATAALLCHKWTVGNLSYYLYLQATQLTLQWGQADGATKSANSSVAWPTTDGTDVWIRATLDVDNGAGGNSAKFWRSSVVDPTSGDWTQVGTTVTQAGTTDIKDGNSTLGIGASGAGAEPCTGTIYRFVIYSDLTETTKVIDADFSTQTIGAGSFTESSSNAATVTINTSGAAPAHIGKARDLLQGTGTNQPAYSAGVFTFDGADNFMQTSTFVMASPVTAVMVVKQVSHTAPDRFMDGFNADTCTMRQVAPSPNIEAWGGTTYSSDITGLALGTRGIVLRVWNGASSVFRHNDNAEITDGTGTIGTTGGITLARQGGGAGTGYGHIAVEEFVVFNSALSLANRNAVITALNNALTVF